MPGFAEPHDSEPGTLLSFLALQRYVLKLTAYGLTEDQVRLSPTASELSIGGLNKHVCRIEARWLEIMQQRAAALRAQDYAAYAANFRLTEDETLAGIVEEY